MVRLRVSSKLLTLVLSLGFWNSQSLRAQDANGIPDPKAWAQQLPDDLWTSTPGITRNFTILPKDPAQGKKWDKATSALSGLGFLQFAPSAALHYFRVLNVGEDGTLPPEDLSLAAIPVQLFLKDEGNKLNFQAFVKGQLKSLGKFGLKKEDRASSEAFYRWLISKFNYDAVVLDQKDDFILAALLGNKTELGQGLLLKNSTGKVLLKSNKLQGEALLQMLRIEGEFVVFESLLASGQAQKITPGTKILLGQSEQLKQRMAPVSSAKPADGHAQPATPAPAEPEATPDP